MATTKPERSMLITGAASGIGAAAVRMALEAGHTVCAADIAAIPLDDIPPARRDRLVTERLDVSSAADCKRVVAAAVAAHGGLDALLHFAGIHSVKTWDDLEAEDFAKVYAVNTTGSFLISQAAARFMRDHGGGAIVLTGSGSMNSGGVGGNGRGDAAYVSSKGGIVALHRALAKSLGPLGIRVNAVSPGATATAMTADYSPQAQRRVAERTILGRIGRAEEIASVALFLASDAASYITGEMINVNGGGSFGI